MALAIFALALSSLAPPPAEAARRGPKVDLAVKDADVRDVLTFLAREAGMNLVMTPAVTGRVTVYLERVRVRTAMDAVLRIRGLDRLEEDGVLLVMTRDEMQRYLELERWRRGR